MDYFKYIDGFYFIYFIPTLFNFFFAFMIFALDEVKNIPSILLRNVFLYYEIYKLDQGA